MYGYDLCMDVWVYGCERVRGREDKSIVVLLLQI